MKRGILVICLICLTALIFTLINEGQKISKNPLLSECHNPSFDPIQINQDGSVKPAKIVRKYMARACCFPETRAPHYVFKMPENTLVVTSHDYYNCKYELTGEHYFIHTFEIVNNSRKIHSLMLKKAQEIYEKEEKKCHINYVKLYSGSSYTGDERYASLIAYAPDFELLVKTLLKSDISDIFEIPRVVD